MSNSQPSIPQQDLPPCSRFEAWQKGYRRASSISLLRFVLFAALLGATCLPSGLLASAGSGPPREASESVAAGLEQAFRQIALYLGEDRPVYSASNADPSPPYRPLIRQALDVPEEPPPEPTRDEEGRFQLAPGWWRVPLPSTGSYFDLYAPSSWQPPTEEAEQTAPGMPMVLFLHGSGATPSVYHPFLEGAADSVGTMLALVRSSSDRGWGFPGDAQSVFDTVADVRANAGIDPSRLAIAGHSSGAAYAYLMAYLSPLPFSAIFTLSAPYRPVEGLRESFDGYVPPIRMYYGVEDWNFTNGSFERLALQWFDLGIEAQYDLRQGYGHNTWPEAIIYDGFEFLVSHRRPHAGIPSLCQDSSDDTLCLHEGRFAVTIDWQAHDGSTGPARALPDLKTRESGVFWFFDEDNWELLVKVIDGCSLNDRFWVIAAATTDVGYTMTVRDLVGDQVAIYENELGKRAAATLDLQTLSACPSSD